ncbi:hypothetical protein M9Y10_018758 [Tritrichomonas musculus]|uniref:F5/8 type C domain-containing protein n=1 Tax=Tritrichomonas musculus TaxID=1915356 RepID=A0ABR2HP78_9EUKA
MESEDQLLKFINKLYCCDVKYSILYETVYFVNVSSEAMGEFISHFDMNDLTASVWNRLSDRLLEDVKNEAKVCAKERYKLSGKIFMMNNDKEFNGIFNYLRNLSNNNIENEVTFDSTYKDPNAKNVVIYEDENKFFNPINKPGNWISFDFKARKVILTDYTIRSIHYGANWSHPKSWVIEGSNDGKKWENLDEENDCSHLSGKSLVHTFKITNKEMKEFSKIRMRSTGTSWDNGNYLSFEAIEMYGKLIDPK